MSYTDTEIIIHTDQDLLERIKNDEQDAFKMLFHKHYKQMYYLAYKSTGNEQSCASIIHDIFLQLWEDRKSSVISSLDVYLFALTSTKIFEFVNESKDDVNNKAQASFKEKFLGFCSGLRLRGIMVGWHWNSSQN